MDGTIVAVEDCHRVVYTIGAGISRAFVVNMDDGTVLRLFTGQSGLRKWDTTVGDRVRVKGRGDFDGVSYGHRAYNLTRGPPPFEPYVKMEGQRHAGADGMFVVRTVKKNVRRVAHWERE